MTDKIDYEFDLINPKDYRLKFEMYSDKKLFNYIFNKSKDKLMKEHKLHIDKNAEPNKIEVPDRFYNLLKTILKKKIKQVSKKVKKDKIELLTILVDSAIFTKQETKWLITIIIKGDYIDKR